VGLPAVPRAAVPGLYRALPGDHAALGDPAAARARPQRRGAGAQGGPGRAVRLARLAAAGIGLWPAAGEGAPRKVATLQAQLARFGYAVPQHGQRDRATELVIAAFQRHFRPERVDGVADRATLARLDGLLALL